MAIQAGIRGNTSRAATSEALSEADGAAAMVLEGMQLDVVGATRQGLVKIDVFCEAPHVA